MGHPSTVGRRPAAPLRAGALRARRRAPVSWPALAGQVAKAVTLASMPAAAISDRAVLVAPGILRRAKITVKGAPKGASLTRWRKRHPGH